MRGVETCKISVQEILDMCGLAETPLETRILLNVEYKNMQDAYCERCTKKYRRRPHYYTKKMPRFMRHFQN